jgi:hypothetical protein
VIRGYDEAGNVIETHEHAASSKSDSTCLSLFYSKYMQVTRFKLHSINSGPPNGPLHGMYQSRLASTVSVMAPERSRQTV